MENNFHYNPKLKTYARRHRNGSTKAEIRIWAELLRGSQIGGYRFLRQRPVHRYIADFMCKELSLIIEVDGSWHDSPEVQAYDARRQSELEALGFSFLRFSNQAVMESLPDVAEAISEWIAAYEAVHGSALAKRSRRKKIE